MYKLFKFVHKIVRLGGFMPFTVTFNRSKFIARSRITKFDIFWLSLSLTIYSALLYSRHRIVFNDTFMQNCNRNFATIELFSIILSILNDLLNRRNIVKILNGFITIDDVFSAHQIRIDYSKTQKQVIIFIASMLSIDTILILAHLCGYYRLSIKRFYGNAIIHVFKYFSIKVLAASLQNFFYPLILAFVRQRYAKINIFLR